MREEGKGTLSRRNSTREGPGVGRSFTGRKSVSLMCHGKRSKFDIYPKGDGKPLKSLNQEMLLHIDVPPFLQ